MSEENDFKKAMSLLMSGRRKEASGALLPLYQQATKKGFKIQIIDALLSAIDPILENQRLIDMASEGAKLAGELGATDLRAHFMSRRADFLMAKISFYHYQCANLKLAPGWIEFSTEADRNNYEILAKKNNELEIEIDQLLNEALALTERTGNKKVLAFILMSRASVQSSRYIQYKMESMRGIWKAKVWLLLHRMGYEVPILFGFKHSQVLKTYVSSFTADYLRAAKLFEEIDDDGAGYAYFDLAVNLKSCYHFRNAKKSLRKAETIAKKYNNELMAAKIKDLAKSIKARNRDVPDYLKGEKREEIVA
jgi:hypothetical protein